MVDFTKDGSELLAGRLQPVYFHKSALIQFLYDPRYIVKFSSGTYGTVHMADAYIDFGINESGSVITWEMDLERLDEAEQRRWQVHNKASDHDLTSDFYSSQVMADFTGPTLAVQMLEAVDEFTQTFEAKFGLNIYGRGDLDTKLREAERYSRLSINGREDDFKTFIVELSNRLNEAVDVVQVRAFLRSRGTPYDDNLRGNGLLSLIYEDVLGDRDNFIAPFFILNDFRQWAAHPKTPEDLARAAERVGVSDPTDFDLMFTRLLEALLTSAEALKALSERAPDQ